MSRKEMIFRVLILIIFVTHAVSELCVSYTFEEDFNELFTNELGILCVNRPFWILGTYSNLDLTGPNERSTSFITPLTELSCVSSFIFSMTPGGTIEVNIYMEAADSSDEIVAIANQLDDTGDRVSGMDANSASNPNFVSGWHTLKMTLTGTEKFNGYISIMGTASPNSIVLVDSFRYIPPGMDESECQLYEDQTPAPDPDQTPDPDPDQTPAPDTDQTPAPDPDQTPDPDPDQTPAPDPDQTPAPDPDQTPDPDPDQTPVPEPDQTPDPDPDQTPDPDPDQTPDPDPDQTPAPDPDQTPAPDPDQTPAPDPDQTPDPDPDQTPAPDPDQTPAPDPDQTPAPEPDQTPVPDPDQTPDPDPDQTPAPEPDQTPAPEPDQTPDPDLDQTPVPDLDPTPVPDPDPTPVPDPDPQTTVESTTITTVTDNEITTKTTTSMDTNPTDSDDTGLTTPYPWPTLPIDSDSKGFWTPLTITMMVLLYLIVLALICLLFYEIGRRRGKAAAALDNFDVESLQIPFKVPRIKTVYPDASTNPYARRSSW